MSLNVSWKNFNDNAVLSFNDVNVKSTKGFEIFGINIDTNFSFSNRIKTVCRKIVGEQVKRQAVFCEYLLTPVSKRYC